MKQLFLAAIFFSLPLHGQLPGSFLDSFDPATFFTADDGRLTDSFQLIRSSRNLDGPEFPTVERSLQFLVLDESIDSNFILRGFRQHVLARMSDFPVVLHGCRYDSRHLDTNGVSGGGSDTLDFQECSNLGANGTLLSFQLNYSTLAMRGVFRATLVTGTEPRYVDIYQYEY